MNRIHLFLRTALLSGVLFALFSLFAPAGGNLWAKEFTYTYRAGEKYKILSEVSEKVYVNGVYSHEADILNRISVEVTDMENGTGTLEGRFVTTERLKGSSSAYQINNTYESVYERGPKGEYDIGQEYYMPVVRNVPLFPEGEVEVGDTWTKRGEEVHDFRRGYGISEPFRIPFTAHYRYLGEETIDDRLLDVISVRYNVRHRTGSYYRRFPIYPQRLSGFSDQTIYWDNEKGRPYAYHEQFSMHFVMSNGDHYEFTGYAHAKVTESTPMDKDKVADEIDKKIQQDQVPDTRVRVDEKGVTIELDNIKFAPDSARLLESEKDKLDRIAEILRSYPDRHLQITGHTALAGTPAGRQQLSEQRARIVADYLLEKGVREPKEVITEGKGAREPIADNSTPEGMRKNRRVEITILEN
jgi:outer membrane protein OmpA-like peptidoglycan-associated protein